MTAIEGVGGAAAPRFGIRGAARRASEFAVPAGPAAAGPAGAAPEAEAVSLTSVLTLQELGSETEADREARRHGQDLLTALAELQRALLSGAGDVAAMLIGGWPPCCRRLSCACGWSWRGSSRKRRRNGYVSTR